jgi:hypothetical protein
MSKRGTEIRPNQVTTLVEPTKKNPKTDILWLPYSSIFEKYGKQTDLQYGRIPLKGDYSIFGEAW